MPFQYTVSATFSTASLAQEWIAWMRDEHATQVIAAGALSAEVVRLDCQDASDSIRCCVQYEFASRVEYERYIQDHAPRLRSDGLRLFPPERGIQYVRSAGEVVLRVP